MKTIIHVNQHVIKKNRKTGDTSEIPVEQTVETLVAIRENR